MKRKDKPTKDFGALLPEKLRTQTIPDKIREALASTNWDALLLIGVENVQYTSGIYQQFARTSLDRQNIVVWPREGEPIYITGAEWIDTLEKQAKFITRFAGYDEKGAPPPAGIVDEVATVLRSEGLANGLIGLEMLRTPVPFFDRLRELVPRARFESSDDVLRRLRMVKTLEEIETMAAVAEWTDNAVWRAFESSKAGDSEAEVGRRIYMNLLENGCDGVFALALGTGEGARVIGSPTQRQLRTGDMVRFDTDAIYNGYFSDVGRMAVVGQPNAEQIKAYQNQIEMKKAIFDFMRPGRTCSEVHAFYLKQADRLKMQLFIYPFEGLGHGLGVNTAEFPNLNAGYETVLEPGMIFAIEPDASGPEGEVMHTEDDVLVTTDGVEVLSQSEGHDWSELLVIPA
jgi:Xaa-Pro dipeptidase